MPMDIAEFRVRTISLEVRYGQAFLMWDKSGSLWAEIKNKYPMARLKSGEPNKQQVSLDDSLEGATHIDRAFLVSELPTKDLQHFQTAAEFLFRIVIETLRITDLSRIGLRTIFEKKFETRELASEFALTCQPGFRRTGKFFNIDTAKILDPSLSLRWEGETMGCTVNLNSLERRLEVSIPNEFSDVPPINAKHGVAILDIDYYAHATTPVSKFNAPAIVENWTRIVRRDAERFVNG